MSWALNVLPHMPPELENEDGVTVEIEDGGGLWIYTGSYGSIHGGLGVPAADMAKLIEAWKERQAQLRREGDPVHISEALQSAGLLGDRRRR